MQEYETTQHTTEVGVGVYIPNEEAEHIITSRTLEELIADRKKCKRSLEAREAAVVRVAEERDKCRNEYNNLTRLISLRASEEMV